MKKWYSGLALALTLATLAVADGGAQAGFTFAPRQFFGVYHAYSKIPPNDLGFNYLPELENSANLVTWGYHTDDHLTSLFADRLKAAKIRLVLQLYLADKPGVFFDQPAGTRAQYLGVLKSKLQSTGMLEQIAFIAPYEEWFTRNSHDEFDSWPQMAGLTDAQQAQLISDTLPSLINSIKADFPGIPTILVENAWNPWSSPAPANVDVLGVDAYFTPWSANCDATQRQLFDNQVTAVYDSVQASYPGRPIMMVPGAFVWNAGGYTMPSVCQLSWYREIADRPGIIGMQWYVYGDIGEPGQWEHQLGFRGFPAQRDAILQMGRRMVSRYRHQILWRAPGGEIRSWDMEGKKRILEKTFYPLPVDPDWTIVGAGDFNGDAHSDILWQYRGNGSSGTPKGALYVWLMDRDQLSQSVPVGPGLRSDLTWQVRGVVDIDNDADQDLVWQNDDGRIGAWVMNGLALQSDSTFSPSSSVPPDWRIVGAGDIDGNGRYDLIWRHGVTGQASAWDMNGLVQQSGTALSPDGVSDLNWKLAGVKDINGDQKADLIWHYVLANENDPDARRVGHWIMNGVLNVDGSLYDAPADRIATGGWRITAIR